MDTLATPPEEFIEVGRMALRDPKTGEFLPAVKLYVKATPGEIQANEDFICDEAAHLLASKMKQYIDGGGIIPKTG